MDASYHFADWFDHAERAINEGSNPALSRVADEYAERAEAWL
jgi:hypothetical protein